MFDNIRFNFLYIDTYSFVIGLNSLKGIQEVPQAYRKLKTVIGGVEVGSATADIFLTYGEGCENEEVCQKLRQLIYPQIFIQVEKSNN
nr:hypothetical protein [uncultured Lachnoanaerobaculum sp.]